jgi:hypothetical protein
MQNSLGSDSPAKLYFQKRIYMSQRIKHKGNIYSLAEDLDPNPLNKKKKSPVDDPDEYKKEHGKCPDGYRANQDTGKCISEEHINDMAKQHTDTPLCTRKPPTSDRDILSWGAIEYKGGIYVDVGSFLKESAHKIPGADKYYQNCKRRSKNKFSGKSLKAYCARVATRIYCKKNPSYEGCSEASKKSGPPYSGPLTHPKKGSVDCPCVLPDFIKVGGRLMILTDVLDEPEIERNATVINMVVMDMTLLDEARRWVAAQLRKRRRVFQNTGETFDIALFSTNVPTVEKLKLMIPKKFRGFRVNPPVLKEITNSDELGMEPKPSVEQVVEAEFVSPCCGKSERECTCQKSVFANGLHLRR